MAAAERAPHQGTAVVVRTLSVTPLVSCIVTAYNYDRFIAQALESVLGQDYPLSSIEIIVVDDGSEDRTAEAIRPYRKRVQYIWQENQGPTAAVNAGLERATGELVGLLDADDRWLPHKVREQVQLLVEMPLVGLVYSDMEVINELGDTIHASFFEHVGLKPLRGNIYGALLRGNLMGPTSMLWRSSLQHAYAPLPNEAPWADWYLALRIAAVAEIDFRLPPVSQYRHHGENMVFLAEGERWVRFMKQNIGFRRWLLSQAHPVAVEANELVGAQAEMDRHLRFLVRKTDLDPRQVVTVRAPDREASHALAATASKLLDDGAMAKGFAMMARGLALDPFNSPLRQRFVAVGGEMLDSADSGPTAADLQDIGTSP